MKGMPSIDRRQSSRLPAEDSVMLTCLSAGPIPNTPLPARIVEKSDYGMRIEVSDPIAPATLVRLDLADTLVLGEVAWCAKVGDHHEIGLRMEQSLQHLGDLRRLVSSLLGHGDRQTLDQPEIVEAGHHRDH